VWTALGVREEAGLGVGVAGSAVFGSVERVEVVRVVVDITDWEDLIANIGAIEDVPLVPRETAAVGGMAALCSCWSRGEAASQSYTDKSETKRKAPNGNGHHDLQVW